MNKEILKIVDKVLSEEVSGRIKNVKSKIFESENMCSECGTGYMKEGMCSECGYMEEEITELGGMDDGHPRFGKLRMQDLSREEMEKILRGDDDDDSDEKHRSIKRRMSKNRRMRDMEDELGEELHGGQRKLDKNKNGRIDREDFKMLRGETDEAETEESREFAYAARMAKKQGKDTFELDGKKFDVKESKKDRFYFTESEMVDIIENIVNEEKKNTKTPDKNLSKSLSASKTENDKHISDVVKKMKEYLKDGSKGTYEMNPKHFPKGNGELGEMDKKAYRASNDVEEYVDNFTAAGLENLDYDDIKPNEDWVSDNVVGSTRTGNNPEWANAVETPVNKKRDKIRKDNLLAKIKKKAYNKAPQPVNDTAGENSDKGSKILMNLESTENKKVITEIEKMKSIIGYQQKTQ